MAGSPGHRRGDRRRLRRRPSGHHPVNPGDHPVGRLTAGHCVNASQSSNDTFPTAVHVAADNYGVVEDVHQSIMHILTQYLRQSMMEPERIGQFRF